MMVSRLFFLVSASLGRVYVQSLGLPLLGFIYPSFPRFFALSCPFYSSTLFSSPFIAHHRSHDSQ